MLPFFQLGPVSVPAFGLLVASAMIVAFLVLRKDMHRRAIAADAEIFIAVPCLTGIVGAKLYHVLESPHELFSDPFHLIFSQYGFAWFGGLIAGFAAFVFLTRRYHLSLLLMLDVGSPAATLGYGVGRIGCFLAGDGDYGVPTSLPWGVSFPNGLVPTTQHVHPTPIYEFIVACIIAWLLWRLGGVQIRRLRAGRPSAFSHHGVIFAAYLVLTGVARFLVEFIRINPRSFFGLTNAQVASAASIIAGVLIYAFLCRKSGAARAHSQQR
ncbi:MAG TPA: prolipoprotein diacylglyceryl transferase [Candidatus Acidoferrales bacterium]|nr:prolipoprotein diacylglyceryl transferase [Candidatus Acidoferrales bacterium]